MRRNKALGALDDVLEKVDGHRVEGRQVGLPVNGHWKYDEKQMLLTEGEDLPLVAELRGEGRHVHEAGLHLAFYSLQIVAGLNKSAVCKNMKKQ